MRTYIDINKALIEQNGDLNIWVSRHHVYFNYETSALERHTYAVCDYGPTANTHRPVYFSSRLSDVRQWLISNGYLRA